MDLELEQIHGTNERNFLFSKIVESIVLTKNKELEQENILTTYLMSKFVFKLKGSQNDKFTLFDEAISNIFISGKMIHKIREIFSLAQKHYFILGRFVTNYKKKKSVLRINTDLFLNELREGDRNVFALIQENSKYLFSLVDLKNMVDTALTNLSYFYIEILPIKNPYNNVPLKYHELVNIYFSLRKSEIKPSVLFELFFRSNFDAYQFEYENESYIKTIGIEKYVFKSSYTCLYEDVFPMLRTNIYTKSLMIHPEFPNDVLVDIFRPYLHLFYLYRYYIRGTQKRVNSYNELHIRLKKFYFFNPQFGRKKIVLNNKRGISRSRKVEFNMEHIPFHKNCHINVLNRHSIPFPENFYEEEEEDDEDELEIQLQNYVQGEAESQGFQSQEQGQGEGHPLESQRFEESQGFEDSHPIEETHTMEESQRFHSHPLEENLNFYDDEDDSVNSLLNEWTY
jgi:hypothetical protein